MLEIENRWLDGLDRNKLRKLISQFTIIIFPEAEKTIIPACYGPIAIDEIALGFWLLFKGANIPKMKF